MVYFDNAATGGFKPRTVIETAENVMKYLCANPGRSGHRLSVAGEKIVYDCRKELADFFDATPERVVFTKNCTEALNLAIFGLFSAGGTVITTTFEHNSVLRPLNHLSSSGKIKLLIARPEKDKTLLEDIESKITDDVNLIVMTAANNVVGKVLPFKEVGELAKKHGIKFILDGAQAGGHIPLSLKKDDISALAVPAHKGLFGIMGAGALIVSEDADVSPFIMGGTGTESFNLNQPESMPEKLESGTLPLPAIAAFKEGVRYAGANLNNFGEVLENYTGYVIGALSKIKNVRVYSEPNPVGIVSFAVENTPSQEIADFLNSEYDIAVRGGFHCAPLTHKYLGTDNGGLVRVSLAPQNSSREINYFLRAVKDLAER